MTMPIPDGSVIITPAQMYAEIREMRGSVDRLANTIDPALNEVRDDVKAQAAQLAAQNAAMIALATRTTIIETKHKVVAWLIGVVVLPGMGALAAVAAVWHP